MYLLYSGFLLVFLLLAAPYFLYRAFRDTGYAAGWLGRFRVPDLPEASGPTIWMHAVSVGEVVAAATLLPAFREVFPNARFVVSVITATGREVADRKLDGVDAVFFCPFDFAFLVRRAMRAVRPTALVILETEIWPHLLREARRAGARTMIAGGRISDRSHPRYMRARTFMRRFLTEVDRFCMQNRLYAERITAMGAASDRIEVTGNLKFDAVAELVPSTSAVFPSGRRVLIAGSTLDPEESLVLETFTRLREEAPDLFLVLAPRHPHRFDAVARLAWERGLRVARRSEDPPSNAADVMVLDTLGELAGLYAEADFVFVGGSLVDWGGHNIIEPAACGKPVTFGPHMKNFADVAKLFIDERAAVQVASRDELEATLRRWIGHPEEATELGLRAAKVCSEHRGAASRTARALEELIG